MSAVNSGTWGIVSSLVYMLAVSNTLMLLSSQTNCFFVKKKKKEMVGFICCSWAINHFSGMSAVGAVYSHPSMKCSSLNVNFTTTTHKLDTSAVVWQNCFHQLRCSLAVYGVDPLKRAYKLWCESGTFIWIIAIFLKLLKGNLQSATQKMFMETHLVSLPTISTPMCPELIKDIVCGLIISAVAFRIRPSRPFSHPREW